MKKLPILRFENGKVHKVDDLVVEERILNVYANNHFVQSIFYSNGNEFYLGIGVLFYNDVISSKSEIINYSKKENDFSTNLYFEIDSKRKETLNGSEYGKISPVKGDVFFKLMKEMLTHSDTFQVTGGTHIVAVATVERLLTYFEDISRLSAVLKIVGFLVENEIYKETILFTSGRINYNIVQIASKVNSKIIVSQSAVSSLAIKSADSLGITLVGFLRGNRFNIYTHPERILQ
ncbi:FdhD/NarQ family protein [Caldisericum exile]|uniref:FdhD protein homolog n=1 Tax=Caldisericum exile (strain DSM 21853 / NBRC 104410 / AZM16c01) TaxID=511051 RepID=A0A7U6GFA3_CALEA|nr:FdhD/NarQ family protein [Caldisericum exile]BAL81316.1 putative FdhD protein homolog [Caldisericum exile AZM16c01]